MSNASIKLNLRQLKSTVLDLNGKNGKVECLVIPIKQNRLFKGDKGIYLDIQAYELKQKPENRKDTHILKQSFGKEYWDTLSDEQKKELPIIGNMIYWDGYREPDPVDSDELNSSSANNNFDDLPF